MIRDALMPTYSPPDIEFEYGRGSYLFANDGRRFLDFGSGIAVNSFGHVHPHLLAALERQAQRLWHTSNAVRVSAAERLAVRMIECSFADRLFLANSGTEAVECGLKVMRHYHHVQGAPRSRIVGFSGGFHGRTIAALGAAGNPAHCDGYVGPDDGFLQLPFNDLQAVENVLDAQIAGVIVEPIQGEGGIRSASPEFLQALRSHCDEFDIPLMFDEVQSGMGRTGDLFAYEGFGVVPDLMALAKGMGGGFPIGACLASERLGALMTVGSHGSTFGGNPLAAAVANGVLDLLLEPDLLPHVRSQGELLQRGLRSLVVDFPAVFSELRGRGLMLGLKCLPPNGELLAELRERGLLLVKAADNVLRLLPPLNTAAHEIDEALAILRALATERSSV